MNTFQKIGIDPGHGICYSGFRHGQQPDHVYPSYEEVREDLILLKDHWDYLRLYDCGQHAETVLEVIRKEGFDLQIMLSAYINAEMNNFNCPWGGGIYSKPVLERNMVRNEKRIDKLIGLANDNPDIVFSLSVGNECCVEWTGHYVHEDRVLEFVQEVQSKADQPVTFCENYVPWLHKLEALGNACDFISIHTYPVWEYMHINDALDHTKANYYAVADKYPDKPVVITEAGWTTHSNGNGIDPANVNEEYQKIYFENLRHWTGEENILTFYFEAFDEAWKGSPDPFEPEKHWGLYKIDRTPKMAVRELTLQ